MPSPGPGRAGVGPALLIVATALAAYYNTFRGSFILDDRPHILDNPYIRTLWPPWDALAHTTRPLVDLTLAMNHAWSGLDAWSYHLLNLAIHVAAGLALFGLARRTLARQEEAPAVRDRATGLALAIALLWVAHPLQTQAVTYVIQRGESMAALFTLLTLYGLARLVETRHPAAWRAWAWIACALGMASKQTMLVAPLLALAYDRAFLATSWRAVWRARGRLHLALFATLALLPLFMTLAPHEWRGSAGLTTQDVTVLRYAQVQPFAVLHYLRLAVWPDTLCVDYGWPQVPGPWTLAGQLAVLAAIGWGAYLLVRRRNRSAFLVAAFAILLLPTSSVVPIADPVVEHRMYLPLAAVVAAAVLAAFAGLRAVAARASWPPRRAVLLGGCLVAAAVVALGARTVARNQDYRSELSIWTDTVRQRPGHARAHNNLALALLGSGQTEPAVAHLREALRLDPRFVDAHVNLGEILGREGRRADALGHLEEAVRLNPRSVEALTNLGNAYLLADRLPEAAERLALAVRLNPYLPQPRSSLGIAYSRMGRTEEAAALFREVLRLRPDDASTQVQLGLAYARLGRLAEAREAFQAALALDPTIELARTAILEIDRARVR